MGPVWLGVRAELRVRWRAPVGLALLLGLAGSVPGATGVRMAFEPGHGRTAVPVRSALVGTTVAITAVVAALVFGASMIGLVSSPHQYGQNWEAARLRPAAVLRSE